MVDFGGLVAVLLVAGYFTDRRSRRVRGHAGRVNDATLSRRLDAAATEQLNKFDAGPSTGKYLDPNAAERKQD